MRIFIAKQKVKEYEKRNIRADQQMLAPADIFLIRVKIEYPRPFFTNFLSPDELLASI